MWNVLPSKVRGADVCMCDSDVADRMQPIRGTLLYYRRFEEAVAIELEVPGLHPA